MVPEERSSSGAFVGRERELQDLRARLSDALTGRTRHCLLVGDAGMGKTRMADELGSEAARGGAEVLWGRCWEGEGTPAFWPWVQLVRAYVRGHDAASVSAVMGASAATIAQVVVELRECLPELPVPPALDPAAARFRLFDSFNTFLKNAAVRQPLVLVLDDLHWADKPSLLLLQFIARETRDARLLLLGTYRDVEVGREHPLADALGRLMRHSKRIDLRGLSADNVRRYIEVTAGVRPTAGLVESVHQRSEGNPFFMTEIVRLLLSGGPIEGQNGETLAALGIPEGVSHTIHNRLAALSRDAQHVLTAAAVVGREFALEVLERVCSQTALTTRAQLLTSLDEARATGIVEAVPTTVGGYRFSHALIRETLYEELATAERNRLHLRVGEALEHLYGAHPDREFAMGAGRVLSASPGRVPSTSSGRSLTELAQHFCRALPGGDVEKAFQYSKRAGEECMALLAFEDAATHFEMALQALELRKPDGAPARDVILQRCELLLSLGDAQMRAGERPKGRETFQQAATVASRIGAATRLARAALGFAGRAEVTAGVDAASIKLLEEAANVLAGVRSSLRARVLGRLAAALYFSERRAHADSLSRQAVEMAEELGDGPTLASVLSARHLALWGPDSLDERLAIATRIVQVASGAAAKEAAINGHFWRLVDLLEAGDIPAVNGELHEYARLANDLRQPFYLWWAKGLQAMRALLEGRFGEAERLAHETFALGQRAQSPNAALRFAVQLAVLRRAQGRLGEMEHGIRGFVDRYPEMPVFRCGLALLLCECARPDEAQVQFEQLAAHEFADLPRDASWLNAMAQLSEVCADLGDTRRAAVLYDLLLPYAGRNVVIGFAHACDGAVARHLGLLATTLSRWDEAQQHFENALAMNQRMGARPYVAHTQRAYAEMLLARGESDRHRAHQLLAAASAAYEALGMPSYLERARRLSAGPDLRTIDESPGSVLPDRFTGSPERLFRKQGDYWSISYEGTIIQLKDMKGVQYIACLLRYPGREFHVSDLALNAEGPPVDTYQQMSHEQLDDQGLSISRSPERGSIPDARAKAEYRRRLDDLRDELDEAERFNDPVRASKAREELDFISTELTSAYGLHGPRRSVEPVERIRKAVGNRIRVALARLRTEHPALWRHLSSSITTGSFCSYNPDPPTTWELS